VANSVDGNADNYLEWLGFVESKLFILLNLIAKMNEIADIRAFPLGFKNKDHQELGLMDNDICKYQFVDTYFLGFKLINNT
jgi:poly(A) polymerase Pap1